MTSTESTDAQQTPRISACVLILSVIMLVNGAFAAPTVAVACPAAGREVSLSDPSTIYTLSSCGSAASPISINIFSAMVELVVKDSFINSFSLPVFDVTSNIKLSFIRTTVSTSLLVAPPQTVTNFTLEFHACSIVLSGSNSYLYVLDNRGGTFVNSSVTFLNSNVSLSSSASTAMLGLFVATEAASLDFNITNTSVQTSWSQSSSTIASGLSSGSRLFYLSNRGSDIRASASTVTLTLSTSVDNLFFSFAFGPYSRVSVAIVSCIMNVVAVGPRSVRVISALPAVYRETAVVAIDATMPASPLEYSRISLFAVALSVATQYNTVAQSNPAGLADAVMANLVRVYGSNISVAIAFSSLAVTIVKTGGPMGVLAVNVLGAVSLLPNLYQTTTGGVLLENVTVTVGATNVVVWVQDNAICSNSRTISYSGYSITLATLASGTTASHVLVGTSCANMTLKVTDSALSVTQQNYALCTASPNGCAGFFCFPFPAVNQTIIASVMTGSIARLMTELLGVMFAAAASFAGQSFTPPPFNAIDRMQIAVSGTVLLAVVPSVRTVAQDGTSTAFCSLALLLSADLYSPCSISVEHARGPSYARAVFASTFPAIIVNQVRLLYATGQSRLYVYGVVDGPPRYSLFPSPNVPINSLVLQALYTTLSTQQRLEPFFSAVVSELPTLVQPNRGIVTMRNVSVSVSFILSHLSWNTTTGRPLFDVSSASFGGSGSFSATWPPSSNVDATCVAVNGTRASFESLFGSVVAVQPPQQTTVVRIFSQSCYTVSETLTLENTISREITPKYLTPTAELEQTLTREITAPPLPTATKTLSVSQVLTETINPNRTREYLPPTPFRGAQGGVLVVARMAPSFGFLAVNPLQQTQSLLHLNDRCRAIGASLIPPAWPPGTKPPILYQNDFQQSPVDNVLTLALSTGGHSPELDLAAGALLGNAMFLVLAVVLLALLFACPCAQSDDGDGTTASTKRQRGQLRPYFWVLRLAPVAMQLYLGLVQAAVTSSVGSFALFSSEQELPSRCCAGGSIALVGVLSLVLWLLPLGYTLFFVRTILARNQGDSAPLTPEDVRVPSASRRPHSDHETTSAVLGWLGVAANGKKAPTVTQYSATVPRSLLDYRGTASRWVALGVVASLSLLSNPSDGLRLFVLETLASVVFGTISGVSWWTSTDTGCVAGVGVGLAVLCLLLLVSLITRPFSLRFFGSMYMVLRLLAVVSVALSIAGKADEGLAVGWAQIAVSLVLFVGCVLRAFYHVPERLVHCPATKRSTGSRSLQRNGASGDENSNADLAAMEPPLELLPPDPPLEWLGLIDDFGWHQLKLLVVQGVQRRDALARSNWLDHLPGAGHAGNAVAVAALHHSASLACLLPSPSLSHEEVVLDALRTLIVVAAGRCAMRANAAAAKAELED